MTDQPRRLIVGVSGASGTTYAATLLKYLPPLGVEAHLVVSKAGRLTARLEMGDDFLFEPAAKTYPGADVGAAIASGSFQTMGMVVVPCSIRTMSEIATGVTSSLLTRAADVCLKERRPLVLMIRETPLHLGHLRTMTQLAEMGAIIAPPLPAFYTAPETVDDLVSQSVLRVLELVGIHSDETRRWDGGNRTGDPA